MTASKLFFFCFHDFIFPFLRKTEKHQNKVKFHRLIKRFGQNDHNVESDNLNSKSIHGKPKNLKNYIKNIKKNMKSERQTEKAKRKKAPKVELPRGGQLLF